MKTSFIIVLLGLAYLSLTDACQVIPSDCLKAFSASVLNVTNAYRTKHKVAPLTQSTADITKIAQDWSCKVADSFVFQHNNNRGSLGENMYASMQSVPFSLTPAQCSAYAKQAVDAWYNEVKSYDFKTGNSKDGGVIGHFTQLVWKGSSSAGTGLGVSSGKDSKGFYWLTVVTDYKAPGNYIGQYTANVFA